MKKLASFGLNIYRDLHGSSSLPSRAFTVPSNESWPSNLWGLDLGEAVREHVLSEDEKQPADDDHDDEDHEGTWDRGFVKAASLKNSLKFQKRANGTTGKLESENTA